MVELLSGLPKHAKLKNVKLFWDLSADGWAMIVAAAAAWNLMTEVVSV